MLGVEFAEAGGWDVGDGDGGEAFELDDDVLVLLDALDDAFNTGEVALGDEDAAANLTEIVAIVEEYDAVVLNGGHTHEIAHLSLGDGEDVVCHAFGKVLGDVAQGLELTARGLQQGDVLAAVVDEDKVMDGRHQHTLLVTVTGIHEFIMHGQEIVNAQLVKGLLDLDLTTVGDSHGVPGAFRAQYGDTVFMHGALSGLVCLDARHISRWFPATSMNCS